ncbi:hypothetical protein [Halomonas llamarensis]|uniref:XRE family transcriptional regulator n=1 Tax=Halomonas llamarensis TaxID=2945104 RepID=A0ABT0SRK3_9GAMM|nr:hypothetical protein [Halomonas llamarensis]MCL7930453.1 hypothetical protein [Halomonas llamarensis]
MGFSLAEASRRAGENSPQRLKDVLAGRQKCSADLVARLAPLGVDIFYVMTGQRSDPLGGQPSEVPGSDKTPIDVEQLVRIAERLDAIASEVGKRLPAATLVEIAADVYNYFQQEAGLEDDEKLNRTLKLVVNR